MSYLNEFIGCKYANSLPCSNLGVSFGLGNQFIARLIGWRKGQDARSKLTVVVIIVTRRKTIASLLFLLGRSSLGRGTFTSTLFQDLQEVEHDERKFL